MSYTEDSEMREPRDPNERPDVSRYPHDPAHALKKAAWFAVHERAINTIEITSRVGEVSTTTLYLERVSQQKAA